MVALTVAISTAFVVSAAFAQVTPPDTTPTTTPPDTTPTTTPPDTTPTTTPPDTTPTTTSPDSTTTTTPDTTTTPGTTPATTTESNAEPIGEPEAEPRAAARDNDIYVGSVSSLTNAQRAAIDAFLDATARLARAQTARAGIDAPNTTNDSSSSTKTEAARSLARAAAPRNALLDSAIAANRAVMRVAFRAQEAFGASASETAEAAARAEAQAKVDAAQADVDRAADALRAVGNGDPLITALLTGQPPAGDPIAQRIAVAQANQGNPPALEALFDFPIPRGLLVSAFGFRIDPLTGNVGFHPGVDISAAHGTPIQASAAGTVVSAGSEGGYGNAVVLDHGDSLATLYGHMVSVAVVPGQHVAAGDVIGYVGSTGRSTGPHLHFEVRIHGVTVDPLPTFKS